MSLLGALAGARIYDLAQPYFTGVPHHPVHPPFLFSMTKQHGEYVGPGGNSSAAEAFALGGHVGTHIDALCHFSRDGKLYGGHSAAEAQSYDSGLRALSIDTVAPIFRRGVLLDVAGHQKTDALAVDFVVKAELLEQVARAQQVEIRSGDVVLVRTGWARFWRDPARFIHQAQGPGPDQAAARWLSGQGIFAAGSDTVAFEFVPAPSMPVHVHLLVERGIHIIECLNLEQLAAERVYTFVFAAAPLKITGATGSPIRPLALVE
ncbi:MAG: cyclase family protein [Acidobacteria bacterium]|nr:cyclase family protein [Acidobacteriota bacterium]